MAEAGTLFHTSPSHVARFERLRDRLAPSQRLAHIVREDWLTRARSGDPGLEREIADTLRGPHTSVGGSR